METNSLSDVVGLTVVAAKCGSLAGFFDAFLACICHAKVLGAQTIPRSQELSYELLQVTLGFSERSVHFIACPGSRADFSQVAQRAGQASNDGSGAMLCPFQPLPSPRPCCPFSNTCSSNGTLCLRRAIAKATLFSIGTPVSASVWARNVGGVFSVTWVSLDSSVNCSLVASGPSRFLADPYGCTRP